MSSVVFFPSPIGGVPFDADFAPSLLFASLYAILIVVGIFRLACPSTRTMTSVGTLIFVMERVAAFSIRAAQVKIPLESDITAYYAMTTYWQSTLSAGYVSLVSSALRMLQSLVVNSTMADVRGDDGDIEANLESSPSPADSAEKGIRIAADNAQIGKGSVELIERSDAVPALPHVPLGSSTDSARRDMPKTRARYRMCFGLLTLLCLLALALGLVASGKNYVRSWSDAGTATFVRRMRCSANAVAFVPILALEGISLWTFWGLPRVHRRDAALLMFGVGVLLNIISIYRAVVLPNTTPELSFTGRGSLNTSRDKVLFYLFHATPEFLATAVLVCVDVKKMFGTGMWGDRPWDPKPKVRVSPRAL